MKILDKYIIKTFFSPFILIFSILFFLFIVNVVWSQMAHIIGKGLTYTEIFKFLMYASASVIPMVLPLTILLASLMAFGEFGERYELAAMKAAGISLARIMLPLFFITCLLSVILFAFQNNISPSSQRKAQNMLNNIKDVKPTLSFTAGQFITQIPDFSIKFDKIEGEKGEFLEGIFIRKNTGVYDDMQSIIAKKGKLVPAENPDFLKLELYNGYLYEDHLRNKTDTERKRQPNQSVKFDTMVYYIDVGSLKKKALDQENTTDDYRFKSFIGADTLISNTHKENQQSFKELGESLVFNSNNYIQNTDIQNIKDKKIEPQYKIDTLKKDKKIDILHSAYNKIDFLKNDLKSKEEQAEHIIRHRSKMILYQQRILAYPFTCIIFIIIGASLGSIIRKGGMGMPVLFSIFIFIILNTLNITVENFSWKGQLDPYIGAWLPNIILLAFGIWLLYKALTDSQVFDAEKYKAFFKPIINKFYKPKEHSRYR